MNGGLLPSIHGTIESRKGELVRFLCDIVSRPAIAPSSGGVGEWDKVELIQERAKAMGFNHIERYDAKDPDAPSGARPNLIVWLKKEDDGRMGGEDVRRLLVVTHTDIVPPGNLDAWNFDPFKAVVKDGRIFGRGTEDNGQSLTASLFAAKILSDLDLSPDYDVGLVMVADEEMENKLGISHLIEQGFFRKDDLVVVPDHGEPDGRLIDVSEKSIAWIKVVTKGVQCHSSLPLKGKNAFRAGMKFGTMIDEALHECFNLEDGLFDHPISSFEPTKKEANVPNVNTVPGEDIFYIDCRVIPSYHLSDVMTKMRSVADQVEKASGTSITLHPVLLEEAASPTPTDAPIVKRMLGAIDAVYENDPYPGGIGGGTCAAVLRRAGIQVAVWETVDNVAHSPNEYAVISNMVNDCKVFSTIFMDGA